MTEKEERIRASWAQMPARMTVQELAEELRVSEKTVRQWLDDDEPIGYRAGRKWVIDRDMVVNWIIKQNIETPGRDQATN